MAYQRLPYHRVEYHRLLAKSVPYPRLEYHRLLAHWLPYHRLLFQDDWRYSAPSHAFFWAVRSPLRRSRPGPSPAVRSRLPRSRRIAPWPRARWTPSLASANVPALAAAKASREPAPSTLGCPTGPGAAVEVRRSFTWLGVRS